MAQKRMLYGAGGLVLGLVVGIAVGAATSESKIRDAVSNALTPGQEAAREAATSQQDAIAALSERIAALEAAMPEAGAVSEQVAGAMEEKISGLRDSLTTAISEAVAQHKASLDEAMAGVTSGLERTAQAAAAAVASATTGEDGSAEGATISEPLRVGQTAIFAGGKVRAFVSRLDPGRGGATLVVNGEQVRLGTGGSAPIQFEDRTCSIFVMGIADEGATLGSDCEEG